MQKNEQPTITPKPVFIRLLMLFGGGAACLAVGVIAARATGDTALLAMSAILSIAFVTKGIMLKRKVNAGQIYSVSGVCVSLTPKMLGRYRRIELVDTATGEDVHFILPKKTIFKMGHVYTCYFDNPIGNRPLNFNDSKGGLLSTDLDLPTNGFLGFEDFGVYQERPMIASSKTAAEVAADNKNEKEVRSDDPNPN